MVKRLFVRELVTFSIGVIATMMIAIAACIVSGITDYDEAFAMGQCVGSICGFILRSAMLLVLIVTVVASTEGKKRHRRKRR